MARLRRSSLTALALTALVVPTAMAATPSSTPSSPSASASAEAATPTKPRITVEKPFTLALDSKGAIQSNTLPTASTLFTKKELAQVVPGLSAVSVDHDSQTLNLTIKSDSTSTLQLVLKRFGKKDDVTRQWTREKEAHQARAGKNAGLYTFFGNKLGADDAFTDGTNTHVLVSSGDAAGEVWFSGSGFTHLAADYASSRSTYERTVVPALVQLLADKAKAGATKDKSAQETAQR